MLAAYAILVLCNVVPESPSNIAQDKIQAIQGMSFELYLHMYISGLSSQKNRKLCFRYYKNRLKLKLKQQHGILLSNWSNFLSDAF